MRQLIEPRSPKETASLRCPLPIGQHRASIIVGQAHGPELIQSERAHEAAGADLPEQQRGADVQQKGKGYDGDNRRQDHECSRAHDQVDQAAKPEVSLTGMPAQLFDRRGSARLEPEHGRQIVDQQAVVQAGELHGRSRLLRDLVGRAGHDELCGMHALDRQIDEDTLEIACLSEHQRVIQVPPTPVTDLIDDSDHSHIGPRHRLDSAEEQRCDRAAAVDQDRHIAAQASGALSRQAVLLDGPVCEP